MARKKAAVSANNLSDLIKKFARNDVIAELEKEYQTHNSRDIPLSQIDDSPFIKKAIFSPERIEELGKSVKEKGIFSPLVVRPAGSHYEVILGRKRYFGAKKAGLETVPCVICQVSDEETLLMILADSRDQRDSNIVEMALLYDELIRRFHYRQKTLANLSHQSRSQVTNSLRLLTLPDSIIREVSKGRLSYGHARAIAPLSEEEIYEAVRLIHKNHLSVRETEFLAKTLGSKAQKDNLLEQLEEVTGAIKISVGRKSCYFGFPSEEEKEKFIQFLFTKEPPFSKK